LGDFTFSTPIPFQKHYLPNYSLYPKIYNFKFSEYREIVELKRWDFGLF